MEERQERQREDDAGDEERTDAGDEERTVDTPDSGSSADTLPALPAADDDTPLGDTDQHSDA
jgi:hypothetical protein